MNDTHNSAGKNIRLQDVRRGAVFQVNVDGESVDAYPGETVAAVLLACGKRIFGYTLDSSPRGYTCGIGRCFSCLVTIDGITNMRACQTISHPGMRIETGYQGLRTE